MRIFGFLRSIVNAVESAYNASNNSNNSTGGVAIAPVAVDDGVRVCCGELEYVIEDALNDPRFTFRSLNALQKAGGGLSRDEVREIVFSLGGRQSSDGKELYTLDN